MIDHKKTKIRRKRRARRVRSKMRGTVKAPRLSVFRSNKYIYAQLIDDEKGETLLSASSAKLEKSGGIKTERARSLGQLLAKQAGELKIKKIVFDRGSYKYHGRIKALAEGAREGGLKF